MTLFQTIMVVLMAVGFTVALGFGVAFVVEVVRGPKTAKKVKAKKTVIKEEVKEDEDNIRKMLAQLEEEAANQEAETIEEPKVEPAIAVVNKVELEEVISQEEPVLVDVVEVKEEVKEEPLPVEEDVKEQPFKVEEPKLEVVTEVEEVEEVVEDDEDELELEENVYEVQEETPKTIVIEKVTTETIGTDFDYSVRLAKIVESKNKMERDLQKTKRAITKYERTQRRRVRNQKMLDRRAVELTNLNLMMYSVTDIKNVDADKKAKQEELTTHIAELKASIQDADLFLAKNKERYEHDKKMYAFYTKEQTRYNDEIKELEILIKNANSVTGTTTTTTTTTTTETVE